MRNNLLPIAKEGWIYILYSVIAIIIFNIFGFSTLEFFAYVTAIFLLYVFRNPERESIIYEQNSVVSPVDGKVISIEELVGNEYAYKVSIDNTYLDVSLLRVPLTSSVMSIDAINGSKLSSNSSLFSKLNEQTAMIFEDTNKNLLKVEHILKQSIAPISLDIIESQKLLVGARYGVMVNGITTLYLPQNFRINVSVGSEVKASQTLIGYFS